MTIQFKRVNGDINGNARYVCSWLVFNTATYPEAVKLANKIGGRRFHNKQYGGGIVFATANIEATEKRINELLTTGK